MIKKGYHIAVVGATGAVGQKVIELLENEMKFNIVEVTLLSSKRSAGKVVQFKGREIIIQEAKITSFEGVDIAFLALEEKCLDNLLITQSLVVPS